ncbi:MAG: hypothetical protein EKK29_21950 [Hyphomicrobiales bacterium]|jgi:hypothetical protein|nr:MAG: hypothetical protein EKK29_21950 [Hyphomicrobiales bacterium]
MSDFNFSVTLGNVILPSHVEWRINTGEDQKLIEVYTGSVVVEHHGGDSTGRGTFFTYLPLSADREGLTLRSYGTDTAPSTITSSAILATPVSVSLEEDQTTFAVDAWGLQLLPQSFPGVGGAPQVLILNFDTAIRNGVLIRVGYHVTLTTPLIAAINDGLVLGGGFAPQI